MLCKIINLFFVDSFLYTILWNIKTLKMMEYINKDNPVYISYAWGEDREIDVNKLCELMDGEGVFFKRDKAKGDNSLCPYRYNIIDAEEEIGRGKAIIVVISDKYIKSLNCMYEWHCICKTGNIAQRVFPIVLPGTKLKQEYRYKSFKQYFEKRLQDISNKDVESNIDSKEKKCLENDGYIKDLEILRNYLKEYNIPDLKSLRENEYKIIIEQLKEYVTNIERGEQKETTTQISTSEPYFTFSVPNGLLHRKVEEENLFNLISQNRIVTLEGVGGCGKSSLAYLCLKQHQRDFNEIAFVVVNNNIKEDIAAQLNKTLKLGFEGNTYTEIISYLQKNFKSDKSNLLVLDINETANPEKTKEFVEEFHQNTSTNQDNLPNWKLLFLTREHIIQGYENINLNEIQDNKFLKKVFLRKTGKKYNSFEYFDELFEFIEYSPMLAELLGEYLKELPIKTLEGIKKLFYDNNFRNEEIDRINTQNRKDTIANFLNKLIDIQEFTDKEKTILCHFVIWPTDYIKYDVIKTLLKGIFSNSDLERTLVNLVRRGILTKKDCSNKETSYKLNGLLADTLIEQEYVSNYDFSHYLDNCDKIEDRLYNIDEIKEDKFEYYSQLDECIMHTLIFSNNPSIAKHMISELKTAMANNELVQNWGTGISNFLENSAAVYGANWNTCGIEAIQQLFLSSTEDDVQSE